MGRPVLSSGSGFSLLELIMVIGILSIVALVVGRFIAQPVGAYLDVGRRATLVDQAETALHRVTREVRLALPNSIRVSADGRAVEILVAQTGGRYRREGPGDTIDFSQATDSFDIIGTLPDWDLIETAAEATESDCTMGTVDCLVIYNTGQGGANAYAGDNVAALTAASSTALSFAADAPFPHTSPAQRFFVVNGPVSFVCNGGSLYRLAGYPITAAHTAVDTVAELTGLGATSQLLSNQVTQCAFRYAPGTASRRGTLQLHLTVDDGKERAGLLQQIQVRNAP